MVQYIYIWVLVLVLAPLFLAGQSKEIVQKHTTYLASDSLEGRGTGSAGIRLAANYIGQQFKEIGLLKFEGASYFQEFPFPGQAAMEKNIVGYIEAAGTTKKSIVFMAHYDGYGMRTSEGQTDSIYNGARDNAVGVAALLALAQQYIEEEPPMHHIVFVVTAGEEFGQHGSSFYVDNPIFPKEEIILNLNIDGFNVSGPREDYFIMPRQGINFVEDISRLAESLGWHYESPDWADAMNTNFDTASFLVKEIPAITLWTGNRLKGGALAKPLAFGAIHSPEDEISAYWNWEGVEDHLMLYKAIADYYLENPKGLKVTNPKLFMKE